MYSKSVENIKDQLVCLAEDYDSGVGLLAGSVAGRQVVGVGESTHGTHEFFQLKADLGCELIQNHGFTVFALEDEFAKCEVINDFIQTGQGDVDDVMSKLYSVWRTEEVKKLILRLQKLATSHDFSFVGIDIDQSELKEEPGRAYFEERDRLMAENVLKAVGDGKVFIWAHNSHVSRVHFRGVHNLGYNLSEKLSKDYAAIGQLFGSGSFSTKVVDSLDPNQNFKGIKLSPVTVSSPPSGFLEEVLDQTECSKYFIGLTSDTRITILDKKYKCRAFGAVALRDADPDEDPLSVQPYEAYDMLIYFKDARHSIPIKLRRVLS